MTHWTAELAKANNRKRADEKPRAKKVSEEKPLTPGERYKLAHAAIEAVYLTGEDALWKAYKQADERLRLACRREQWETERAVKGG